MSQDPEKRDIDPSKDRVWRVDVWADVDFPMYVVAASKEEAVECANAHWEEEWREYRAADLDPSLTAILIEQPIRDSDWEDAVPWGRSMFAGKQLKVNQVIDLILTHPALYDTQTQLMPFVDSPPPLRTEGEI